MLILGRNAGESIIIDGRVRVTVMEHRSTGKIRLAIDAPLDVRVDREEVHEKRMQEIYHTGLLQPVCF